MKETNMENIIYTGDNDSTVEEAPISNGERNEELKDGGTSKASNDKVSKYWFEEEEEHKPSGAISAKNALVICAVLAAITWGILSAGVVHKTDVVQIKEKETTTEVIAHIKDNNDEGVKRVDVSSGNNSTIIINSGNDADIKVNIK